MVKKDYKQPTIKQHQLDARLLDALSQDPNGNPTAKRGVFYTDDDFDYDSHLKY